MYKKTVLRPIYIFSALTLILLCGCGETETADQSDHEELAQFRTEIDEFCTFIQTTNEEINNIDSSSDTNNASLLSELDSLDQSFLNFSELDFPSDYDYLESVADEAYQYMNTAVTSYHDLFENNYDETSIDSVYAYASENYSRAYKRVEIIMTFLNGETSDDATITGN